MIRDSLPLLLIAPIIRAMADSKGADALPTTWAWVGLIAIVGLAAITRLLRFEQVFLDDGTVVFAAGDAYYHAHRTLYSFLAFPDFLRFDPCINWPDGAAVPHPPLHDLFAAGIARLLAGSALGFERVLAWLPVVFGALTVIPVYLLGTRLRSPALGLGAASLYALLPIAIEYSRIGNADHHAAAGLLGAILLLLYTRFLGSDTQGSRLVTLALALALTRVALLGTWHGSLLYLGIGELAIILYGVSQNREDILAAETGSVLLTALLAAVVVGSTLTPAAGPWSATELSNLHVLAFVLVAGLCTACIFLQRTWPLASPGGRTIRAGCVGIVLAGFATAIPGLIDGLQPAFAFVTRTDEWGASVQEQLPLFYDRGEWSGSAGEGWLGYYAYLVPFVPIAFALLSENPRLRARALFLFTWSFVFGGLTLYQLRFGNDFAAAGCVGFALFIAIAMDWVQQHTGLRGGGRVVTTIVIGLLLCLPGLDRYLKPVASGSLAYVRGENVSPDRALQSIEGTQLRFAEQVSRTLPEAEGCLANHDLDTSPRSGILADPALGHVLHQVAHRATPSDPFGPYIGEANYHAVLDFLFSESEPPALRIARELKTPWVATAEAGGELPDASLMRRLHRLDGSASSAFPHLGHFRLVTEGPAGGLPISVLFEVERTPAVPYKLWEIVPGALIELHLPPGEEVNAQLAVRSPIGRRFVYRARATANDQGIARLRVPYATSSENAVRTGPHYVIDGEGKRWLGTVSENSVQNGEILHPEPQ